MIKHKIHNSNKGLTLIEILTVIGLIALMVGTTMVSYSAIWGNLRFKREARELVNTFQMARQAAATSDRRYAVVLDFIEQAYVLREFKSTDLLTMDPEEAIIQTTYLSEAVTIDYVQYDDLEDTRDSEDVTEARFLAGKAGWQYGGKIALLDADGRSWTIIIHRLGKPAELFEGDVGFLLPQNNVPF